MYTIVYSKIVSNNTFLIISIKIGNLEDSFFDNVQRLVLFIL